MHRISKRIVVRALAVFGWLCLVFASSPALGQGDRFIDESQVYDIWMEWLQENGESTNFQSAAEIYQAYGDGFFITYAWDGRRDTIRGEIVSSNRFVWLAAFPVALIDSRGAITFPNSFAPMSDFEGPTNVSSLVRSVWDSSSWGLRPDAFVLPMEASFLGYRSPPLTSDFRHGSINNLAVRCVVSNVPVGYITGEVRQGPVWYGSRLDLYVTPSVYRDITGEWPSDNEDRGVVCLRQRVYDSLIRNASIRTLERWRTRETD